MTSYRRGLTFPSGSYCAYLAERYPTGPMPSRLEQLLCFVSALSDIDPRERIGLAIALFRGLPWVSEYQDLPPLPPTPEGLAAYESMNEFIGNAYRGSIDPAKATDSTVDAKAKDIADDPGPLELDASDCDWGEQ